MTNNKQKRTAMELTDSLTREIRYYCEENGIDTTLGFELAKSIRRENDLVATYVDLGEDGYADWISDMITSHFEEEEEPEVAISYLEAIERARQGTLPTCPHLERVKVFKACYADCIIQYVFGTECNLSDDWKVEELGYLSYINMTNKDENLQRMIDEYMDGDAGSCRKDCIHYKSCNE